VDELTRTSLMAGAALAALGRLDSTQLDQFVALIRCSSDSVNAIDAMGQTALIHFCLRAGDGAARVVMTS